MLLLSLLLDLFGGCFGRGGVVVVVVVGFGAENVEDVVGQQLGHLLTVRVNFMQDFDQSLEHTHVQVGCRFWRKLEIATSQVKL